MDVRHAIIRIRDMMSNMIIAAVFNVSFIAFVFSCVIRSTLFQLVSVFSELAAVSYAQLRIKADNVP